MRCLRLPWACLGKVILFRIQSGKGDRFLTCVPLACVVEMLQEVTKTVLAAERCDLRLRPRGIPAQKRSKRRGWLRKQRSCF